MPRAADMSACTEPCDRNSRVVTPCAVRLLRRKVSCQSDRAFRGGVRRLHRMRLRDVLIATSAVLAWLGGCSSDGTATSTSPAATTASTAAAGQNDGAVPTVCAAGAAGGPTVTIDVDDDSDGFGRFGLRTPSPLPAGTIRLEVNSVEANTDPVSVTVANAGATVFEFVEVGSGVLCAADLELAAGDYTVTFGDKTKTFTVEPQP